MNFLKFTLNILIFFCVSNLYSQNNDSIPFFLVNTQLTLEEVKLNSKDKTIDTLSFVQKKSKSEVQEVNLDSVNIRFYRGFCDSVKLFINNEMIFNDFVNNDKSSDTKVYIPDSLFTDQILLEVIVIPDKKITSIEKYKNTIYFYGKESIHISKDTHIDLVFYRSIFFNSDTFILYFH